MKTAVPARDAASLIIYREDPDQRRFLLGRRPSKSRFMPDVYVYPGGMVDHQDARVNAATELDPRYCRFMAVANSTARARTLALAAVRETFEETGLLVTREGNPGAVRHESWANLREAGLAADLAPLRYVGRAITPTDQPIRFHARFFAVDLADLHRPEQTVTGNGELLDLDWYSATVLADMPLRRVTRYMLNQVSEFLDSDDTDWIGDTMFTQRDGKIRITRRR